MTRNGIHSITLVPLSALEQERGCSDIEKHQMAWENPGILFVVPFVARQDILALPDRPNGKLLHHRLLQCVFGSSLVLLLDVNVNAAIDHPVSHCF